MPHEFRTTRRVQFGDTDMAGIVHFVNFFRYMEETEHEFLRSLGLSVVHKTAEGFISWPRVAVSCEFFKPARFDDVLEVRLRVEKRASRALTYVVSFHKGDVELARGRSTAVCCRVLPGQEIRSIEIPPPFSDLIQEAPPE